MNGRHESIRVVDGAVLPAAGTWTIDPGRSEVAFTGRHLTITRIRGRFTDVAGAITIAEDIHDSRVEVVINMATVESGNPERDAHLRSSDLFDVEEYALATFRSRRIDWRGTSGLVQGELTMRGVTREVPLAVSFKGYVRDPWGGDRAIFSGVTAVNREDFGVGRSMPLDAGGLVVSRDITINVEIETLLVNRPSWTASPWPR